MPSAHHQSLIARKQKAMNRTLQSANAEKLEPGHRCLQIDVREVDETCWALWNEYHQVCEDDWSDNCEAVMDEVYE